MLGTSGAVSINVNTGAVLELKKIEDAISVAIEKAKKRGITGLA